MAQALPRFCPRCGTATRANMRLCPTCGLSVKDMFSRREKSSDLTSQESTPESAHIVPAPDPVAEDDDRPQPVHEFEPPWAVSSEESAPPLSLASLSAQDSQDELQDTNDIPDVEDWPTQSEEAQPRRASQGPTSNPGVEDQPTQIEHISPLPPVTSSSRRTSQGPASNPGVEDWPTQIEQAQPRRASQGPTSNPGVEDWPTQIEQAHRASQGPASNPGMEDWPTQIEQRSFSPLPPTAQDERNTPDNLQPVARSQETWQAPLPIQRPAPQPAENRRRAIMVVLLVALLLLGGGGYLAYSLLSGHLLGGHIVQSPIKTTNLNLPVNYAGIDITILNVEQAQNFLDDPQTTSNGMLRLNLQEQNKTTAAIHWDYSSSARLVPQGAAPIAPVYVKSQGSIAPGATQKSILDFPIVNGGNLNKLIFQLGASNEAQIQIPLAGQAGIDRYKPQTSQPNGTTVYFGLNWTLTSATTSLNIPGQQAPSGMEFLVLTLKVDNTLSQEAITGSPFDYLRVQAGGKTAMPMDTTLPVSFAAGDTGKTSTATFLIPQNSKACTLILLSQDPGTGGQAAIDFQV